MNLFFIAQAAASTSTAATTGATAGAPVEWNPWQTALYYIAVIGAVFVLPFVLSRIIANSLKMPAHAFNIAIILASIIGGGLIVSLMDLKLGPDINGGTNLIYEMDKKANAVDLTNNGGAGRVSPRDLVPKLAQRLNPSGTKEILIRPSGDDQIEIIVPNVAPQEVEEIKRSIRDAGILQFRIVANQTDHQDVIQLARKQATSENETERLSREVRTADGKLVGVWQAVGRDSKLEKGIAPFKTPVMNDIVRDARTGRLIEGLPPSDKKLAYERWLQGKGIQEIEVLLALERGGVPFDVVNGDDIATVRRSISKEGTPEVEFTMKTAGATRLQSLTFINRPDDSTKFHRRMAIVLDGRVLSAPNLNQPISSQGSISGNFTNDECEFLVNVLRSGSLPAALNKTPISENVVGAAMGKDAINKGVWSCILALIVTLVFMLFYYRFSGFIACLAMAVNLLLVFAGMILIQQPLTLPGLAGLVLSVGMSVDANVLVFERIREEIAKKSTGRMAIRNGFDRAWSTIIDSNLTTMISAVVLYYMGTDQVKGFAITLIIGLIVSMFTAVFCSRVFFDIAEKWRFANFSMADMVAFMRKTMIGEKDIDFMSMRFACYSFSSALILIGLVATAMRGREILDIDFNGGTSVIFALNDQTGVDKVRGLVQEIFANDEAGLPIQTTLTGVEMKPFPRETVYKLDTSLKNVDELSARLVSGFTKEKSGTTLVSYKVTPTEAETVQPVSSNSESAPVTKTKRTLTFATGNGIDAAKITSVAILDSLISAAKTIGTTILDSQISIFPQNASDWTRDSQVGYPVWDITLPVDAATSDKIIDEMSNQLAKQPVWQSISRIESRVAGQMQRDAIIALLVSMLFIVAYIWFRFQKVAYGLAAVVALVHDVLITLTFIAVSHWLFKPLGVLMIEDFKISLTMVAAFLTIIGYSLNDTIVVFDRIREVKGKSPKLTNLMVNQSLNQTLGRTLLTSMTTIFAVFLLYIFGGEGLHGFAFALLVGILIGTYSSIFVAAPILLWLANREKSTPRIGNAA